MTKPQKQSSPEFHFRDGIDDDGKYKPIAENEFRFCKLNDQKNLAALIGAFVANFSHLEAMMFLAFVKLVGDEDLAVAILSRISSADQRIAAITEVASKAVRPNELADLIGKHAELIGNLRKVRNQLAHGNFVQYGNGVIRLHVNTFSGVGKFDEYEVNEEQIRNACSDLIGITTLINGAIKGSVTFSRSTKR